MAVVQVKNLEGQGRVCALLRSRQLLHKNVPKQSQVMFSEITLKTVRFYNLAK